MGVYHSETNLLPNFQNDFNSLKGGIGCILGCLRIERLEKGNRMSFVECIMSLKSFWFMHRAKS